MLLLCTCVENDKHVLRISKVGVCKIKAKKKKELQLRGIEPRTSAWKADILPLWRENIDVTDSVRDVCIALMLREFHIAHAKRT